MNNKKKRTRRAEYLISDYSYDLKDTRFEMCMHRRFEKEFFVLQAFALQFKIDSVK